MQVQVISPDNTNICRTCLALKGVFLSIYDTKGFSEGSVVVADMLRDLTNILPKRTDGMPEKVCLECFGEINRCYSFKLKCDSSDRTLRQLLKTIEEPVVEREEEQLQTEPSSVHSLNNKEKKPQKRIAETSVRILDEDIGQVQSSESNDVCAVLIKDEQEVTYYIIGVIESDGEENSHDCAEILHSIVETQENKEKEVYGEVDDSEADKSATRRSARNKAKLKCPLCLKTFVYASSRAKHMSEHQEEQEADHRNEPHKDLKTECYSSNVRDKAELMKEQIDLVKYKRIRTRKKKYQCSFCRRCFRCPSEVKDHIRSIHTGEKPYTCSICNENFCRKRQLSRHILRHGETRPFKCEQCPRSFYTNSDLKKHVRRHTGYRTFICDICKKVLTSLSSLTKHKRIHTEKELYTCEFCPKRFSKTDSLNKHRKVHSGERPYKCKYCQQGFKRLFHCVVHMQTHTGERRYACKVCDKRFAYSYSLVRHMKMHKRLGHTL